jgi:hypothetical protein
VFPITPGAAITLTTEIITKIKKYTKASNRKLARVLGIGRNILDRIK